ncbi:sensor domain-containing diguanylate cyclase [Celerinatantimonas yamalensis]|uniref:diguanylate cyclase n=1 Tax=Celerinatantimonas yamalensis TaxID=559956 RepID=A0ABW9G6H7_9GAMM
MQNQALTQLSISFPSMKPNTALGFLICGLALLPISKHSHHKMMMFFGFILVIFFTLTLLEYWLDSQFKIDEWLFKDPWSSTYPGRPSIVTTFCFIVAGLLLLLYRPWLNHPTRLDILGIVGLLCPLVGLLGYIYNPVGIFKVPVFSSMALHTSLGFILFFITLPIANRRSRINYLLFSQMPGSRQFRRLLIPTFALPLLIGLIYKSLVVGNILQVDFALALFAASFIAINLAALIYNAFRYNKLFADLNAISEDNLQKQLKLTVFLDSAAGALILFSDFGRILSVTRGASNILGWSQSELEKMTVWELIPNRFKWTVLRAIVHFRRHETPDRDNSSLWLFAKCENGDELAVLVSVTRHTFNQQWVYGALVLDAQRLIDHIQRLNRDINIDSLTHAHNRRALEQELQTLRGFGLNQGQPFAIAMIDVDHFKSINDQYGHRAGDVILQSFTRRIQNCLRHHDRLYRYGGDEFVVIAEASDYDELKAICERIRSSTTSTPISYQGLSIAITCSIGMCSVDGGGALVDACLSGADQALYHAKQQGRNRLEICSTPFVQNKLEKQANYKSS